MLIVLIIVAIFIGLLIAEIILKKKSKEAHSEYQYNKYDSLKDASGVVLITLVGFGIIAAIFLAGFLGFAKIDANVAHDARVEQREAYVEILKSNGYIYTDTDFYDSVVEFNYEVDRHKMYADSLWLNWFQTNEWKGIEPIDLDRYKE